MLVQLDEDVDEETDAEEDEVGTEAVVGLGGRISSYLEELMSL